MKIAMVFPGFSRFITGGAAGLMLHLCDELIKMGNQVTLFTTKYDANFACMVHPELKIVDTGSTYIKDRDLFLLLQHYSVAKIYKYLDNSFDIINVHNYPSPLASALAQKLKKCNAPIVYQCNEPPRFLYDLWRETFKRASLPKKLGLLVMGGMLKKLDKWSVSKVDEIITISRFMQNQIRGIYSRDSIFIMPGIEIDRFTPDVDEAEIRARHVREGEWLLLTANLLHPRKKIDILIKAMPYVLHNHQNVKVIITGDGPDKKSLEQLIISLGLQNHVVMTGFIPYEELPKYYAACDIFVFTAIGEPQLGSPAEALASGKPVIAPNDGSPAETIIEGETGLLFKPLDSEDLATKITWCIEHRDMTLGMAESCRRWVEQNMNWGKMARETYEVFERVAR